MRRQVDHLLKMADLPNVTLQVLPFEVGAHAGMDGSFAILGYEELADPDVVFAENAAGGLFLEKDEELRRYHVIFEQLRVDALTPEESVSFLAAQAKER
jgi:hypothetical protein